MGSQGVGQAVEATLFVCTARILRTWTNAILFISDVWGHDMVVTINKGFSFYCGFDGDVPKYQFDLVFLV